MAKKSFWRHPVTVIGAGLLGLYVVGPAVTRALGIGKTKKRRRPDVTVYGAPWCPACMELKADLEAAGIRHAFRDIETDAAADAFVEQASEDGVIPVVVVKGQTILGYDREAIEAALGRSLVPRATLVPGQAQ